MIIEETDPRIHGTRTSRRGCIGAMKTMKVSCALGMLLLVAIPAIWLFQETTVRVDKSPDGRYSLVVLQRNLESIIPVAPGQGSDAKCNVELREQGSGRLIFRKEVAMLQDVGQIQWERNKVWLNARFAITYDGSDLGNQGTGH